MFFNRTQYNNKSIIVDEEIHERSLVEKQNPKAIDLFLLKCEIAILTFSCVSKYDFNNVIDLIEKMKRVHDAENVPIILVGTQMDLFDPFTNFEDQIDPKEVFKIARKENIPLVWNSSKYDINCGIPFKLADFMFAYESFLKNKKKRIN
eukprot:gb/GECH01010678.1/.p1 GENE.gb/GECH01010678.1/~~gb/GECH01010678.1/.p1  ORF type:complete len:149 (+),score=41.08 gb/GECH01010678.1/:1-447(+)